MGKTDKVINANCQLMVSIIIVTTNIFKISLVILKTPCVKKAEIVSISETTLVTSFPTAFLSK